jgi:hypothetical protein
LDREAALARARLVKRLILTAAMVLCLCGASAALAATGELVWSADHETGDMSQWPRATLNWDSGLCLDHGVSSAYARSGSYSLKLEISTLFGTAGCRQARNREIATGNTYIYSAWYRLPKPVLTLHGHWNVFQFKSKCPACSYSDPMWSINFEGDPLRPILKWSGGSSGLAGPQEGDGVAQREYPNLVTTTPIGRWTHLRVRLRQSGDYTGRITVWHDGVRIYDLSGVRTRYPDGSALWSVNNYSNGLTVNPYALYIDDVSIRTPVAG